MTGVELTNIQLRDEIVKGNEDVKSFLRALEVKLSLKIEEISHRLNKAEKENDELKRRVEYLERERRRNGIIIFGLERHTAIVGVQDIVEFIGNSLKVKLVEGDINSLFTLGRNKNSPIKVEFTSYLKKLTVLKNTKNLKGSSIRITQDLTEQQRSENKILRKHLYSAKQRGVTNCYIRKGRFHMDDRVFTPADLECLEEEGFECFPSRPHSDPGTPIHQTKSTKEEIGHAKPGESTVKLPPPTQPVKLTTTNSVSERGSSITPKPGTVQNSLRALARDRPNTRKNSAKASLRD